MKTALVVVMMLMVGCAAHYSKAGATSQEFARDLYECEVGGRSIGFGPPAAYPSASPNPWTNARMAGQELHNAGLAGMDRAAQQRLVELCLTGRGWVRE